MAKAPLTDRQRRQREKRDEFREMKARVEAMRAAIAETERRLHELEEGFLALALGLAKFSDEFRAKVRQTLEAAGMESHDDEF